MMAPASAPDAMAESGVQYFGSMEVANRLFVKRTRRGKIRRVVREHYLRDDLLSGSPRLDPPDTDPRLSPTATRYLVPDSNAVLHQMDVLEHPHTQDVVLLQTVLAEVRHRRVALYNRARALAADPRRRVVVFCNENHRGAQVSRSAGESANDYNDRAIRAAVAWYSRQLEGSVEVLLLTNDRDNIAKARAGGLAALTVHEWLEALPNAPADLLDRLAPERPSGPGAGADGEQGGVAAVASKGEKARAGDASGAAVKRRREEEFLYPAHLSPADVSKGVAQGVLVQGRLRVNRHNPREGFVQISAADGAADVRVSGRDALNRGVHGDIVAVRLLPRNEWAARGAARGEGDAGSRGGLSVGSGAHVARSGAAVTEEDYDADGAAQAGDEGGARIFAADADADELGLAGTGVSATVANRSSSVGERPCGEVVAVVRRNWRACVGVLDFETQRGNNFLFEPVDVCLPRASLNTRQGEVLRNQLIVAAFDSWEQHLRHPSAHYVATIGPVGTREAEAAAILYEHGVPMRPFSAQVQACLPPKGWTIPADEIARREDLRETALVCSVDPPGCVDIDDALHVRRLANGSVEVGVHIADVGHFIKAGTPIDEEAAARATTVYLVDRRIDMVPKRLGEDLCSLHEGVDRLAFSVIWEFAAPKRSTDADVDVGGGPGRAVGEGTAGRSTSGQGTWRGAERNEGAGSAAPLRTRFAKTVIRSRRAFSYEAAQDKMDDKADDSDLATALRELARVARTLREERRLRGSLTLASPEVRFKLDSETSDPTDVGLYAHRDSNAMVEEFMLLANTSVAREIATRYPALAVLRRHPPPRAGAFDGLQKALRGRGIALRTHSSRDLADSLDEAQDASDPYVNELIRILATRAMQQAEYFRAGSKPPDEYWHYGLAADIYTHFTSPIRRYADQLVHRMLAASIGWEPLNAEALRLDKLEELVDNMNRRHVAAQHAGRASIGVYTLFYFKGRQVDEDGYVVVLREKGVVVLVPRYGIECIVPVGRDAPPGRFVYDEEECTLRTPKAALRLFDKLSVRISVDSSKLHRPRLAVAIISPQLE